MDQSRSFPLSGALERSMRELGGHRRANEAGTFFEAEKGKGVGVWRRQRLGLRV